jgi:hypothetical protein
MQPFKYKPPLVRSSDLRTEVQFYELVKDDDNPFPVPEGQEPKNNLYKCWSMIENVWSKDIEIAKANGTLSDLTLKIRDPQGEYLPTTKHHIEIFAKEYDGVVFNVKEVFPDLQNRGFIKIIAEVRA